MSRKFILIVAFLLVVAFCIGVYEVYKTPSGGTAGQQKTLLGTLFPFGSSGTLPSGTGSGSGTTTGGTGTQSSSGQPPVKRLVQVTQKVVAGETFLTPATSAPVQSFDINGNVTTPAPALPVLRFAESGTGYLYDVNVDGTHISKTSATVIARTAQAIFAANGNEVALQYLKNDNKTIATFLGKVTAPATPTADGSLVGDFLPENIPEIVASNDQKNMLFLLPTDNGVAGISMASDGTNKKQVFQSSFSEWMLDWPATGPALTTKASADVPGYSYVVNSAGVFQKQVGGINGLTAKYSPDGLNVLYGVSGGNGLDLHLRNLKTGTDANTGLQTLPEKCVWKPDSTMAYCGAPANVAAVPYPDSWYQGTVQFSDGFWKISTKDGTTTEIDDGEGDNIDATKLSLDSTGMYLAMVNKTDGTLWSLNMNPNLTAPAAPALPTVQ